MARTHGRIMAAIWNDGDFIAMRGSAQRMFMFLLSQPDLSYTPTAEALADEFTAELLLRQMKRDWQTFKRRYDHMAAFAAFIRSQIQGESA